MYTKSSDFVKIGNVIYLVNISVVSKSHRSTLAINLLAVFSAHLCIAIKADIVDLPGLQPC